MNIPESSSKRISHFGNAGLRLRHLEKSLLCSSEIFIVGNHLSSEVVTGFTIPVAAIFDRKLKNQVLAQLLKAE